MDISLLATKADLQILRKEMATTTQLAKTDANIELILDALKNVYESEQTLREDMKNWKDELKEHFEVIAEDLRHDLIGTHKDKISALEDRTTDHGRRIRHLEKRMAA